MANLIRIRVTQQHIDESNKQRRVHIHNRNARSPQDPITLAIQEQGIPKASVTLTCVYPDSTLFPRLFLRLPAHATRFVRDFDKGRDLEPFEFELDDILCKADVASNPALTDQRFVLSAS